MALSFLTSAGPAELRATMALTVQAQAERRRWEAWGRDCQTVLWELIITSRWASSERWSPLTQLVHRWAFDRGLFSPDWYAFFILATGRGGRP